MDPSQNPHVFHATTIVSVRRDGQVVIAGDGQVTLGHTVMKANARKVRRLGKDGRVLAGFHLVGAPAHARTYPPEEFVADAEAAGLRVDARFGSYELHPPAEEYAVWVLSAAGAGAPATEFGHAFSG